MNAYLTLKTLHIISAALLFGTGLGTAFFMWFTHHGGDAWFRNIRIRELN